MIYKTLDPSNKYNNDIFTLHKKVCGQDFGPLGLNIKLLTKEDYEKYNLTLENQKKSLSFRKKF